MLIGKNFGRYHILEQLGEGGMAMVYKAYDTRLEREVAINLIRKEAFSPEVLERVLKRFEREAKALARLSHTHIINVHDYGEYEGSPYIVMEYMPGGTLKEQLGAPMPPAEAARLLRPIAQALAHAHREGIIHRDVKPSNILIDKNGAPKLTDFGIARILELGADATALTGTGMGVGTPEYMAPEQGLGQDVDARTDIYALGVVLYEMVTGVKPYQADTPMAVVIKHIHDPLPRPSGFVAGLPAAVEQTLVKALAKEPENRYQDMDLLAIAFDEVAKGKLEQIRDEDVTTDYLMTRLGDKESDNNRPGTVSSKRIKRWVWAVGGTALVVLILFMLIRWFVPGIRLFSILATNTPTATINPTSSNTIPPTATNTYTQIPTATQTSTMEPTTTYTITTSPTYTLSPTRSPTRTPTPVPSLAPVISNVRLRYDKTSNGMVVYQDIYYQDVNGDAYWLDYTLVSTTADSVTIKDGSTRSSSSQQKSGAVDTGVWTCGSGKYSVTLQITVLDEAGHRSNALVYTMNCE